MNCGGIGMNIEEIWKAFSEPLKSFINKRVRSEHDVDDILQIVFIKIFKNLDSLKEDQKLQAWIYQITRNSIIDYYRKEKLHVSEDFVNYLECDGGFDGPDVVKELSACIRPMVIELPVKYKEALELTEFHGLTQKQLSEKLGLSFSGAKSRVQRGREKLKMLLLECCHFEFDRLGHIIDYTSREAIPSECKTNCCD
jgi:RNA polymerase sigma-70 factor (ECF subfamily)